MKDPKARINLSRIALLVGLTLAVPALTAETAKTGRVPSPAKKWFPGHHVMVPPDTYATNDKSWRVLQGEDSRLSNGLHLYVTWGQIETNRGSYRWEKIDTLLNALPAG